MLDNYLEKKISLTKSELKFEDSNILIMSSKEDELMRESAEILKPKNRIVLNVGFGLGIIVIPTLMQSIFGWPNQDPIVYGVMGSVYLSFALLSILGLRAPLKFVPVLFLQLSYKVVWFIGVLIPLLVAGKFPIYGILHVIIFASFIIGDLIAIPFPYVFSKQSDQ